MTIVVAPAKPQAIAAFENDDIVLLRCDLDFTLDDNSRVLAYAPTVLNEFGCDFKQTKSFAIAVDGLSRVRRVRDRSRVRR